LTFGKSRFKKNIAAFSGEFQKRGGKPFPPRKAQIFRKRPQKRKMCGFFEKEGPKKKLSLGEEKF